MTGITHEVGLVDLPVLGQVFELHEHAFECDDDNSRQDALKQNDRK